ncbi:hypothetical protein SLEP1_g25147 [Rubroshorea leprosula]|uniref:Uncharacterized protein n=1 Tax=Rubroshorea leprosula TaxID=152421 RepID=A0AAV5JVB4_9ROSI|nr:hypothetical protein SLEP1_g25147 [Rubroshorea leprosula]
MEDRQLRLFGVVLSFCSMAEQCLGESEEGNETGKSSLNYEECRENIA